MYKGKYTPEEILAMEKEAQQPGGRHLRMTQGFGVAMYYKIMKDEANYQKTLTTCSIAARNTAGPASATPERARPRAKEVFPACAQTRGAAKQMIEKERTRHMKNATIKALTLLLALALLLASLPAAIAEARPPSKTRWSSASMPSRPTWPASCRASTPTAR